MWTCQLKIKSAIFLSKLKFKWKLQTWTFCQGIYGVDTIHQEDKADYVIQNTCNKQEFSRKQMKIDRHGWYKGGYIISSNV